MKELFTMWRNTRMIVLVALTAAIYAAVLVPFKAIPLIPGITEIRPANVFPPVFSLLFGPAAAWGSAIGNLIGDFLGGTFGLGSAFGFVGNFFFGLVPYAVWGRMGVFSSGQEPNMRGGKNVFEFVLTSFLASTACAVIIAWGLEVLKMFPFAVLGNIITVNNFVVSAIVGPILLFALYPRVKRWGLLWKDIMPAEDVSRGASPKLGSALLWIGVLASFVIGNYLSIGVYDAPAFAAGFAQFGNLAMVGKAAVVLGLAPFMLVILVALFLL